MTLISASASTLLSAVSEDLGAGADVSPSPPFALVDVLRAARAAVAVAAMLLEVSW